MKKRGCVLYLFGILTSCIFAQEQAKVRAVRFDGNHRMSRKKLEEVIQLKPSNLVYKYLFNRKTQLFSANQFQEDSLNLIYYYQNEGFANASIDSAAHQYSSNGKRVKLTFFIREEAPYRFRSVQLSNDSTPLFEPAKIKRLKYEMQSKPGKRVREEGLRNDQALLSLQLSDLGYPYAEATPMLHPDTAQQTIALQWALHPGPLAYIDTTWLTGETKIKPATILRQLKYRQGDKWSQKKLNDSQKSIFSLGAFGVVSLKAQLDRNESGNIPVKILLRDTPRFTTRFGIGYGKEDRLRTFVEMQVLRFPGGVGRLNLYTRYSYIEPLNISLKYTQPAFPLRTSVATISPYFVIQKEKAFELSKFGGELSLLNKSSDALSSNITFYAESIDLKAIRHDEILPEEVESAYDKFGISIGSVYSTAKPSLDPLKGFSISSNIKWNAPIFNDRYPFFRFIAKAVYYAPIHPLLVLATKIQLGGIHSIANGTAIPVEELFYGGGSASVRGWSRHELGQKNNLNEPLGGQSLLEFTLEPRIALHRFLTLALFLDAGNVWGAHFHYPVNDLRYAVGFGLRVKTPIGPVGLDVARPIWDVQTAWLFHVNIGNPF